MIDAWIQMFTGGGVCLCVCDSRTSRLLTLYFSRVCHVVNWSENDFALQVRNHLVLPFLKSPIFLEVPPTVRFYKFHFLMRINNLVGVKRHFIVEEKRLISKHLANANVI